MLNIYSHSQSGIPNNAGPFSGTTKKLHQYFMPLLIIVSLHVSICDIHELLYAATSLIFVNRFVLSSFMFAYGKTILHSDGHYFAITTCVYFYLHVSVWVLFVLNFAIITDLIENLWS